MTPTDYFVVVLVIAMLVAFAVIAIVSRMRRRADSKFLAGRNREIDENLEDYLREQRKRSHEHGRREFVEQLRGKGNQ